MAARRFVGASATLACGSAAAWWNLGADQTQDFTKLPTVYDAPEIERYWDQRPRQALSRLAAICGEGFPFIAAVVVDYLVPSLAAPHQRRAEDLKELLVRLGYVR